MGLLKKLLSPFIGLKEWFMARSRVGKVVVILILLAAFFIIRSITTPPAPPAPEFATVSTDEIKTIVSASGTLKGKENASLHFLSGGKLGYLGAKSGDKVTKGQVIARLDVQDLGIALQQAQNNLRDKEAALAKIYDDLKGKESTETFAERQARTTIEVAKDNAFDSVRAARRAFNDAVIISPIAGVVTAGADLAVGQNIGPADLIAQVSDFSGYVFEGEVDEADIGKISLGQDVEMTLDAYEGRIFKGKTVQILPSVQTSATGATTVTVRIALDDKDLNQIYGLSGTSDIVVAKKESVLTVPLEAILDDNQVIVQRGGTLTKVIVKTGLTSDTSIEILDGVTEGEQVVTNPQEVSASLSQ